MGDAKISELTETTTIESTDEFVVNDGGTTKKVQAQNMLPNNVVNEAKIASGAVSQGKIAADAIINAKIADEAVQEEHIKDGEITECLGALLAAVDNDTTIASDVKVAEQYIDGGYLAKNGDRLRVLAHFSGLTTGPHTAKIKLYLDDGGAEYLEETWTSESLNASKDALFEIEILRDSLDTLRYVAKIYLMNSDVVETTANEGIKVTQGSISLNGTSLDILYVRGYVISSDSDGCRIDHFTVDLVKRVNTVSSV